MSTTLILAEKPSLAKSIADAILPSYQTHRDKNRNGYFEGTGKNGKTYYITWAFGHMVGLAEAKTYDMAYKKWDLTHLPILPSVFQYHPNKDSKGQLNVIKDLAKKSSDMINACDAGREGEGIFGLIYDYLKLSLPVMRLWSSAQTIDALRLAFTKMKSGTDYHNLFLAAKARSEADWLVGINATRAFTTKHNNELYTIGRVQTPVLALIYDRTILIENFTVIKDFAVEADFEQGNTIYRGTWQGERFKDEEKAKNLARKVQGKPGKIVQYDVKESNESAPKLYNLSLLQSEANKRFGFSAQKTLDIAQSLYEKKHITYPRTSSNYLEETNVAEMHKVFNKMKGSKYDVIMAGANPSLVNEKNRNICDASKVTDHHAILPTHIIPSNLEVDEEKLYDMIVRRFLSHFFPPAKYRNYTVMTEVEKELFKTTAKELIFEGWRVTIDKTKPQTTSSKKGKKKEEEKEEETPELQNNKLILEPKSPVQCIKAEAVEKKSSPPKPYTEGTLITAMKTAGKEVDDEQAAELMKENGLGTEATRANIIERLKESKYIEEQKKNLIITKKGRLAIELVRSAGVTALTSAELTGAWEKKLNDISKGQFSDVSFINEIKQFTIDMVSKVKQQQAVKKSAVKDMIAPCPACSGSIVEGKKAFGCANWKPEDGGCKFAIWKSQFGRTLTEKQVKDMLEKGHTAYLKFKSKEKGTEYEARLKLKDVKTGSVTLEFKPKGDSKTTNSNNTSNNSGKEGTNTLGVKIGTCPHCKNGEMVDKGNFYACNTYPACKFTIPKVILGVSLSEAHIEMLLQGKDTDILTGFRGKKEFDASLGIRDGKVSFIFSKN